MKGADSQSKELRTDARVARVMRRQMAQASVVQLADIGVTAQMIRRRVEAGSWERPWKNLVRLAGSTPSPEQDLLGVCLAHGSGAVVCGESAAWLWGMPGDHEWADPIHVLCMGNAKVRLSGVETHRSRFVVPADMTAHRGVPVTSWARAIIDNSARSELSDTQLEWMIDEGVRRKELTYGALHHAAGRLVHPAPGRSRRRMTRLLANRPNDWDPDAVAPESRVARWLAGAGFGKPRTHTKVDAGGVRVEIDVSYPRWRLGWNYEADDPERRARLEAAGWLVDDVTRCDTEASVTERAAVMVLRRAGPR